MLPNLPYKNKLISLLHFLIVIGIFTYILRMINWSQAMMIFNHINFKWIGLAFLCSFLNMMTLAKRYSSLLHASAIYYSFLNSYRAYLASAFVSLAMPGIIGGDVLRIFYCTRDTSASVLAATTIVFTERILGVIALITFLNFGIQTIEPMKLQFSSILLLLTITLIGSISLVPRILKYITSRHFSATNKWLDFIIIKINYLTEKLALLKTITVPHLYIGLCLSILAQFIDILVAYFLSLGLGFNLSAQIFMLVVPLSYLAIMLPISPSGLGVREGVFVLVLAYFGLSASDAALLALAVFFTRILVGLVGGINMFGRK